MTPDRNELLALINRSPEAVAVHDKDAWMSIFAQSYTVEDPVGSVPHRSRQTEDGDHSRTALSNFYDAFIAANDIVFAVDRDIVCGNHVMRDLTLNISMSGKLESHTPMHLLYELTEEGDELKVARLAAHWEFSEMNKRVMKKGLSAVPVMLSMTSRLIKVLGLKGMLGFNKASNSIGSKGKEHVDAFLVALSNRGAAELIGLFDSDACAYVPYGKTPVQTDALLPVLIDTFPGELSLNKVIAAGQVVAASFSHVADGASVEGVVLFRFNEKTAKFSEVVFYFE